MLGAQRGVCIWLAVFSARRIISLASSIDSARRGSHHTCLAACHRFNEPVFTQVTYLPINNPHQCLMSGPRRDLSACGVAASPTAEQCSKVPCPDPIGALKARFQIFHVGYSTCVPSLPAGLLLTLAFFAAVGPLSIDMYLPGLPQLQQDLSTTPAAVQLTISGFMIGMALGNLLFGPVSDATGRKRPIVLAAAVLFATAVFCAVAPTIEILIAARFAQGLAGGCLIVVSRAVIPDVAHGTAAARAFSGLMALTGFMPAIAPALGGLLLPHIGWRGIFWVLAAVSLIQLVAALFLPETLPPAGRARGAVRGFGRRLARCLARPSFVGYMVAGALGFGALFAYIAASPLVLQTQLGFSPTAYAYTFGAFSLLLPASNVLNMRLLKRASAHALLRFALLIDATVALALIPLALGGPSVVIVPLLALLPAMSGFIGANATALAVEEVRDIGAGAGSGAMGFTQFVIAAAVAPLAVAGTNYALGMALTSLGCAVVALLGVVVVGRGAERRR